MHLLRKVAAATVSTVALSSFCVAAAQADDTSAEPCAQQQTQLDRANAKLAELTQKFQQHPTMKNKKAKKAQAQRVDRAQARLDACQAGSTDDSDDTSTDA